LENPIFRLAKQKAAPRLIVIKLSHFVEWSYGCRCGFIQPFAEKLDLSAQYDKSHRAPKAHFLNLMGLNPVPALPLFQKTDIIACLLIFIMSSSVGEAEIFWRM